MTQHLATNLPIQNSSTHVSRPSSQNRSIIASVHISKVASLPEALTQHEFRLVCQINGLPVEDYRQRLHKQYEIQKQPQNGLQISQKSQKQINEFCDQLYSNYLALYEQFKLLHKALLRQDHLSPESFRKQMNESEMVTRNPFTVPVLTEFTSENQEATERQKKIVQLMIELSQQTPGTLLNQYAALAQPKLQQNIGIQRKAQLIQYSASAINHRISSQSAESSDKDYTLEIIRTQNQKPPILFKPNIDLNEKSKQIQPLDATVGHDQESLVRKKQLEKERYNMINYKWSDAFNHDKDLVPRDEPDYIGALRSKYIARTLELQAAKEEIDQVRKMDFEARKDANKELSLNRQFHDAFSVTDPSKKPKINKPFDVQFLDVTKNLQLPPDVREILDAKLKQLANMYEGKNRIHKSKAENAEEQIFLMNQVQSENLKPQDLTMEKLIELLGKVEKVRQNQKLKTLASDPYTGSLQVSNRPPEIWAKFHEVFGPDYFLECIEEEYGIKPGSNDHFHQKIEHFFTIKVAGFKEMLQKNIQSQKALNNLLQKQLDQKNEEIAGLRRKQELTSQELLKTTRNNLNIYYQGLKQQQEEHQKREKNILLREINNLKHQRDSKFNNQENFMKMYALRRWQMFKLITEVLEKDKECCSQRVCKFGLDELTKQECVRSRFDQKMRQELMKFMQEEILVVQDPKSVTSQIYSQNQLMDEIVKIQEKWSEDKVLLAFVKNQCTVQSTVIQEMRAHIEEQRRKIDEITSKEPTYKSELENLQLENIELRKQAVMITEKLETLEKRQASGAQIPYMLTIKNLVKGMELKSTNELAQFLNYVGKAPKFSLSNSNRNVGVMTDVNNLENRVGLIYEKTDKLQESGTQTDIITNFKQTQTDLQTTDTEQQTDRIPQIPTKTMGVQYEIVKNDPDSQKNIYSQNIPVPVELSKRKTAKVATGSKVSANFQGSQSGLLLISGMQHTVSLPPQNRATTNTLPGQKEKSKVLTRLQTVTKRDLESPSKLELNINNLNFEIKEQQSDKESRNFSEIGITRRIQNSEEKGNTNYSNSKKLKKSHLSGSFRFYKPNDKLGSQDRDDKSQSTQRRQDVFFSQLQLGINEASSNGGTQKDSKKKQANEKLIIHKTGSQLKPLSNIKDTPFASSHKQLIPKFNSIVSKKQEDTKTKNLTFKSNEPNDKSGNYMTISKSDKNNLSHIEHQKINTSDSDIVSNSRLSSTIDPFKQIPEVGFRRITEKHPNDEFDSPNLDRDLNSRKLLFPDSQTPANNLLIQNRGQSAIKDNQTNEIKLKTQNSQEFYNTEPICNLQMETEETPVVLKLNADSSRVGVQKPHSGNSQQFSQQQSNYLSVSKTQQFKQESFAASTKLPIQRIKRANSEDKLSDGKIKALGDRPKIQQLLIEGIISEQQFIALKLLEKGALFSSTQSPQAATTHVFSSLEYNKFRQFKRKKSPNAGSQQPISREGLQGKIMNIINAGITERTVGSTIFGSDPTINGGILSPQNEWNQMIQKPKKTFKETRISNRKIQVVPKAKLPVLQKVFDKVYKQKRDAGTQLDYMNESFEKVLRIKQNPNHSSDPDCKREIISINSLAAFRNTKKRTARSNKRKRLIDQDLMPALVSPQHPHNNINYQEWRK